MINIDLTTKNTVYNTLGPQAQWIQHRFGRRDYPDIELNIDQVLAVLAATNHTINFNSCYGDPSSHSQILRILDEIETGKCVFNSHLSFNNNELISLLNKKNAYIVVPIFGVEELNNKILLNSNWDWVASNIKNLDCTVCLEFYVYEFNKHQIDQLYHIFNKENIKIEIRQGITIHPLGFSTIVNEYGQWLYDVYSVGSAFKELTKTVNGYNSLIQFTKPAEGRSILNNPLVYKLQSDYKYDNNISVAVTGEVFESEELANIFSNALSSDWNLSLSKITNIYESTVDEDLKNLCSHITKILDYLKRNNNIYKKDFGYILSNLTNSDI